MKNKKKNNELEEIKKEYEKRLEVVRNDINLEKWELFVVKKYKGKSREIIHRTKDRELKIIVGKTEEGLEIAVFDVDDWKVYYALVRLWEKAGKPLTPVNFTLRQLAGELGLPDDNRTYKYLRKHLERLRFIPIKFIETYYYKDGEQKLTVYFTLLGNLKLFERKKERDNNQQYFAFSSFRFSDEVLKNLIEGNTKPVLFNVVKNLKTEIAVIVYRYLDLILYSVDEHEIDLKKLAEMCGITEQPIWRIKQRLKKPFDELIGKEITGGVIVEAKILPSNDHLFPSGWKCYFKKATKKILELQQTTQRIIEAQELKETEQTEQTKIVVFKFKGGPDDDVHIAGDFTNWKPEKMGYFNGEWSLPVELSKGTHFYKFVVKGNWVCDPQNPKKAVDNYGNENSVVVV